MMNLQQRRNHRYTINLARHLDEIAKALSLYGRVEIKDDSWFMKTTRETRTNLAIEVNDSPQFTPQSPVYLHFRDKGMADDGDHIYHLTIDPYHHMNERDLLTTKEQFMQSLPKKLKNYARKHRHNGTHNRGNLRKNRRNKHKQRQHR